MVKKIAIVVSTYPPYRGGMGNVAFHHAEELRKRGHTVEVFTPATYRPVLRWGNGAIMFGLARRLRSFDHVFLHYPFFGTAELIALSSVRYTLIYHMDAIGRGLMRPIFSAHRRTIQPFIFRRAKRIIVSSLDYALPCYVAWKQKFFELPLGVDTQKFTPKSYSQELPERILFVGSLDRAHYFKGLDVLLDAVRNLDVQLTVVGDGDRRSDYESIAPAGKVTFLGNVSDDQLPEVYRSADLLVLPSIDRSEAFGLVILEAMASGLPVIASDLPGVRTVVRRGETGWLVRANDAHALALTISEALSDPDRLKRFGTAARRIAEIKYDWKIIGEKLDSLVRD